MTSPALTTWQSSRLPRLDQLIALHPDTAGSTTDPAVAEEWTHALVLRLTSEFQGFCRDLHDDLARTIARLLTGQDKTRLLIIDGLTRGRDLDQYSATVETLVADFDRLGIELPSKLPAHPRAGPKWKQELLQLHWARNGVVHDDPSKIKKLKEAGVDLNFVAVVRWRNRVDALAEAMDHTADSKLSELFGIFRWEEGENVVARAQHDYS
jgi:hypothetical protein